MQRLTVSILHLIVFLSPCLAWAGTSLIEIKIPVLETDSGPGLYQLIVDEKDSRNDLIRRKNPEGDWSDVYQGEVTSIELPVGSSFQRIGSLGARGRQPGLVSVGSYNIAKPHVAPLRFRTVARLGVVTQFGTALLPWPGQVLDVSQLDNEVDHTGLSIEIISVKGFITRATYLILNDDYSAPYLIDGNYHAEPLNAQLDDGLIHLPRINKLIDPQELRRRRKEVAVPVPVLIKNVRDSQKLLTYMPPRLYLKYKVAPTAEQILDELIEQLDEREPMASAPNAEAQVRKAVRAMLYREFPEVENHAMADPRIDRAVTKVVNGIGELWLSQRIRDGKTINRIMVDRLEAEIPRRSATCELSLMSTSGPGGHAAAYYRGEVVRGFNTIFHRLYK